MRAKRARRAATQNFGNTLDIPNGTPLDKGYEKLIAEFVCKYYSIN